ncbi:MAG: hypothetical protein ABS36_08645 [Acidobacteria bacterium SCN 69-37]|nr:MAG: hypothetical protein ABS36_08645 [Acidobacteria bacterium SCN 69-37]
MGKIRNTSGGRSKRPRKAPAKAKGLRIQLKGTPTLPELRGMVVDVLHRLDDLGITHARGINLYLTPVTPDGTPVTPVANGQPVTLIVIDRYRSAADEHGL